MSESTGHWVECENQSGLESRLDKFLVESIQGQSRSRLQSLILDGQVLVNGLAVKKAGALVPLGAVVRVHFPPLQSAGIVAESIPLDIIFENDDLLVINKPAGMVVHPAVGHTNGTLVNAVLGYEPTLEGIGGEERPGIVHRLDKETSGLIVVAKNEQAHRWLQEQFRSRSTVKIYQALVDGKPATAIGRIEAAIGRDQTDRKKMAVTNLKKGREAISEYKTLESFRAHTLLEFHPLTGRTHQIRLHCKMLGCPITGDKVYGHRVATVPINRHFLHAYRLSITLPGETSPRTFMAPLPAELEQVLTNLRKNE